MQSKNSNKYKKLGFTLLETLVAIGTVAIVLPLIFAIFFVILREQGRFAVLKQVKSEGESALYQIKNTIKTRAIKACSDPNCTVECTTGDVNVYFQDVDGNIFRFFIDSQKIASESIPYSSTITPTPGYLTSDKVKIEPISTLTGITPYLTRCELQGDRPIVDINFKISFNSNVIQYPSAMIYKTKVRLISY